MQGIGVGLLVASYAAFYTLYQKTWGSGGSYLYWLSGSQRFAGPVNAAGGAGSTLTRAQAQALVNSYYGGGGGSTNQGPLTPPSGQPNPRG